MGGWCREDEEEEEEVVEELQVFRLPRVVRDDNSTATTRDISRFIASNLVGQASRHRGDGGEFEHGMVVEGARYIRVSKAARQQLIAVYERSFERSIRSTHSRAVSGRFRYFIVWPSLSTVELQMLYVQAMGVRIRAVRSHGRQIRPCSAWNTAVRHPRKGRRDVKIKLFLMEKPRSRYYYFCVLAQLTLHGI